MEGQLLSLMGPSPRPRHWLPLTCSDLINTVLGRTEGKLEKPSSCVHREPDIIEVWLW